MTITSGTQELGLLCDQNIVFVWCAGGALHHKVGRVFANQCANGAKVGLAAFGTDYDAGKCACR
jgi:hypothetical protein